MKLYEKILISLEIIITVFYSLIILARNDFNADGMGVLIGALLALFLIPYFIAYLISKFSKSENKKLTLWKAFIKIYPLLLILNIVGAFNQ